MRFLAVVLALVPALAWSAPPPTARRVSPLLIPMDQGAEAQALKLETFMTQAIEEYPTLVLKRSDDLFGLPPDEESERALKRAEQGYRESRTAFDAHQYEDAGTKLRATVREYYKAAGAMKACGNFCDALAMFAATHFESGDADEARALLLDLLSLNQSYELSSKRFSRDFITLRAQTAGSRNASLRGNASVTSKPNGARVYLDGEFMGFTPAALQTLPVGKHLLRVEKPGFQQYGEFVEVTPEDIEVKVELQPNSAYRAYDALLDKVAAEVSRDKPGNGLKSMGKSLGLDRAIVGTLKEVSENGALELIVGFYDMKSATKLSGKKIVFEGDEYGQLKAEVSRVVNHLLNSVGGERQVSRSADPLDGRTGQEDWGGEERGGKSTGGTKKRANGDPLESVNGMEDW